MSDEKPTPGRNKRAKALPASGDLYAVEAVEVTLPTTSADYALISNFNISSTNLHNSASIPTHCYFPGK